MQTLPTSAEEYQAGQRARIAATLAAVNRQWRRMGPEFDASWRMIRPRVTQIVAAAQVDVTDPASGYVSRVLRETGQDRADDPFVDVDASPLVGFAGDGRRVSTLLDGAPARAKLAVAKGATSRQALQSGGQWLNLATGTALSDAGRQAEVLHTAARPVGGYVRMLSPPSCSRCAVLAGKWFRKNQGFARHPGCDCRHIPASEGVAGDLRLNANDYFESLPVEEQERVFTKAGAGVIREGADPSQVVNTRRGMTTAQQNPRGWIPKGRQVPVDRYGQRVFVTTEGTTKHGLASRKSTGRRGERLMPESIVQIAEDRQDLVRLLKLHGYA